MKTLAALILIIVPTLAPAQTPTPGFYSHDGACLYIVTQEEDGVGIETKAMTSRCRDTAKKIYNKTDDAGIYKWESSENGFFGRPDIYLQAVSDTTIRISSSKSTLLRDKTNFIHPKLGMVIVRQEVVKGLERPVDGNYAFPKINCVYQLTTSGNTLTLTLAACHQAGKTYTFTEIGNGVYQQSKQDAHPMLYRTDAGEVYLRALSGTEIAVAAKEAGVIHLPALRGNKSLPIYFLQRQ